VAAPDESHSSSEALADDEPTSRFVRRMDGESSRFTAGFLDKKLVLVESLEESNDVATWLDCWFSPSSSENMSCCVGSTRKPALERNLEVCIFLNF